MFFEGCISSHWCKMSCCYLQQTDPGDRLSSVRALSSLIVLNPNYIITQHPTHHNTGKKLWIHLWTHMINHTGWLVEQCDKGHLFLCYIMNQSANYNYFKLHIIENVLDFFPKASIWNNALPSLNSSFLQKHTQSVLLQWYVLQHEREVTSFSCCVMTSNFLLYTMIVIILKQKSSNRYPTCPGNG